MSECLRRTRIGQRQDVRRRLHESAPPGHVAYELATYSETLTHEGAEPSPVRGRYLLVWKRDADGQWRVHRNMFQFISGA